MLTSGKANKLKLTQLIGDYLIENRSVSLPGFGLLMYDSTIQSIHHTETVGSSFAQGSLKEFSENRLLHTHKKICIH